MASSETVASCVALLAETFGKVASATRIEAYAIGLSGLSDEHVKAATQAALRSSKFMPSPAELRELAGEAKPEDAAERAWSQFSDAVTRYGPYKTLFFEDCVISAVVRSFGGLEVVIEYTDEEWQFFRARFLKAYAARRRTGVGDEEGAPLLGYADRINEGDDNRVVIEAPKMVPLLSQQRQAPGRIATRAAQ
jgi:hypothetical protein